MKTVAIVNPRAGDRRSRRIWPRLLEALGTDAGEVATWWTEGPGHAEILAAAARRQGFERVLAAGGDGTGFEVANGLWWESSGRLPSLGVVPLGTGRDYVRNFDLGRDLAENLATALGEKTVAVDAGLCQWPEGEGQVRPRIFLNTLGLGFDGDVIARFRRSFYRVPGRLGYILSGFLEWLHPKHYRLQGEIDGKPVAGEILLLVMGLSRYFGGGLMITPGASPAAGRFQVVWAEPLRRLEILGLVPGLYRGRHLSHPRVHAASGRHLKLRTEPPARLEAEGEPVGLTPVEVSLLPGAFRLAARGIR